MKISALKILEGEAAPWWYGFSYRLYNEAAIVCYPVPFNWFARWLRSMWIFLRSKEVEQRNEAYDSGYRAAQDYYQKIRIEDNKEWSRVTGLAILAERERSAHN